MSVLREKGESVAQQTPWAILRCKWSDDTAEPESDAFFDRLFTPAGAGTRNMVEFFDLMSHGNLDVSGSEVFGWFTLPKPQSTYLGNVDAAPPGLLNRQGLVALAKSTATLSGVDLSSFYNVVVCMNTPTDLFGGGAGALCSPGSFEPAVLGQEMGHGYGLAHSRVEGSSADYMDPWDVMSTWNSCYIATDSDYAEIGPGLNAANMRGRGWLDEARVWGLADRSYSREVVLRPLHRRDLPGILAAQVGEYLVEFRVKESWDAAIPRAAVLVHSFVDNVSYIHPGNNGNFDLVAGDVFEASPDAVPWVAYTRVEVDNIDAANHTATVNITRREARRPDPGTVNAEIFGGVAVDGGGFIVVAGKVIPVPPRDPMILVLEQLAALRGVDGLRDTAARNAVRTAVMQQLAAYAEAELQELGRLETPPAQTEIRAAPAEAD